MLKRFRKRTEDPADPIPPGQLAAAALLVETARADFHIDPGERAAIHRALAAAYGLGREEAQELVARAEQAVEEAVSLHDYVRRLNDELSPAAKVEIVEMLWRVAFADGRIDKYEEHVVRKAADLLYVPHRRFIRAKLKVAGEPHRTRASGERANR